MDITDRIAGIRAEMTKEGLDVYIVSNTDPHNNELVAARWRSREWLSGVKGSAGTVVVTADWCGLWTDSRYYFAAEEALEGTGIELVRASELDTPSIEDWIKINLPEGSVVGFYGGDVNTQQGRKWTGALEPAGYQVNSAHDLIDRVWQDRPAAPVGEVFLVPDEYAGKTVEEKIAEVRAKLKEMKVDAHLLGRTDESCWLFNFRGTDTPDLTTPYCYTLITEDEVRFFIDPAKLGAEARQKYETASIILEPYEAVEATLKQLPETTRILLVPSHTNLNLSKAAEHCINVTGKAVVTHLKGVKNATEVKYTKEALIQDGVAMTKFFAWFYRTLDEGGELSELRVSQKLREFRSQRPGFRHNSFEAIVGYAAHGALNHYSVDEKSNLTLQRDNLLLIDSGGNYLQGTTDTTRVIPLGTPTQEQKEDYTVVLQALIDLITARFAEGATGAQLDAICRQEMWKRGCNFKHGTGHGVGFGLEVHEGPQNISATNTEKFVLGQISTIEPGCYRPGKHGVRIENMVHTVLDEETDFGRFFKFENLTWCPINVDLVDPSILKPENLAWLNRYNAEVVEKLSPHLDEDEMAWLKHECRAVEA